MGVGTLTGDELLGFGFASLLIVTNVVTNENADVVFFDFAVVLLSGFEHDLAPGAHLLGSSAGDQPSVADATDAPGRRRTPTANPDWR